MPSSSGATKHIGAVRPEHVEQRFLFGLVNHPVFWDAGCFVLCQLLLTITPLALW